MRKFFTIIIFILVLASSFEVKAISLSSDVEVSVLTCGPSSLIHAIYGHTAIRVNDPIRKFDVVFNYGVFSFREPNFVYRFAKGQTDYMLAPEYFEDFHEGYKRNGRDITEQVLNLNSNEKQQLVDFLIENAKPENREYRYNFFYDNCATRVRDVVENHIKGNVVFPELFGQNETFRKHVNVYQKILPWTNFGIHLTLGSPSDQVASAYEEMFLPDFLMSHFAEAKIESEKESRQLVKETRLIYESDKMKDSIIFFLTPVFILSLAFAFVIFISVQQIRKKTTHFVIDNILLFLTGITGVVLLWFVCWSEHPAMKANYNILWALPSNLFFMFAWMVKKWRVVLKWYWPILSVWMLLFLLLSFIIPQSFHIGFILISLMLLFRSIFQTFFVFKIQ